MNSNFGTNNNNTRPLHEVMQQESFLADHSVTFSWKFLHGQNSEHAELLLLAFTDGSSCPEDITSSN